MVDIRGADVTDSQLRDDLMTMLIAGHETTAAVLTWCLYCLVQDQPLLAGAATAPYTPPHLHSVPVHNQCLTVYTPRVIPQ